MMNNNGFHIEQQSGAKNRARSVDTGPRNNASVRSSNVQQQPMGVVEHHHRYRAHPINNVGSSVDNGKEQSVSSV